MPIRLLGKQYDDFKTAASFHIALKTFTKNINVYHTILHAVAKWRSVTLTDVYRGSKRQFPGKDLLRCRTLPEVPVTH